METLGTNQSAEWRAVLSQMKEYDFYHLPSYHELAERNGEGVGELLVHKDGRHVIALPLLFRTIPDVPGLPGPGMPLYDATSVYGYAGPLASDWNLPREMIESFQAELRKTLLDRHVVSVFSRLHPLFPQPALLEGLGTCKPEGLTISIDLSLAPADQVAQYRQSHKKGIRRLRAMGVECFADVELRYFSDFLRAYYDTMERTHAASYYFFPEEYFRDLCHTLRDEMRLFVCRLGDETICAAMFVLCDRIVQGHLGGTRSEFLQHSPMKLLFDTVREWGNAAGARIFHVGGGVGSAEDSLFRFKEGFSQLRQQFFTWRWILSPGTYDQLTVSAARSRGIEPQGYLSSEYFPAYRHPQSASTDASGATLKTRRPVLTGDSARVSTPDEDATEAADTRADVVVAQRESIRMVSLDSPTEWIGGLKGPHDFYHLPFYHAVANDLHQGEPRLFVFEREGYQVSLPLLLRRIDLTSDRPDGRPLYDATSVYGYAGPVASHADIPAGVRRAFQGTLTKTLRDMNVVSLFSRLHPLLDQKELVNGLGVTVHSGRTVSIDLRPPEDLQWAQYRNDHRQGIRKLRDLGVVCEIDSELRHLDTFIDLYLRNMERVGAKPEYFFERSYFYQLMNTREAEAKLFTCLIQGELACAAIFLKCGTIIQYHLSAASERFWKCAPTKLMIDTARQWGAEAGATTLHLGGGVGSSEDALFLFKAGFSKVRHEFQTWRWVLSEPEYTKLVASTTGAQLVDVGQSISLEFFPAYRS